MQAWCPPGIRPIVGQQVIREYVYAYAAVAPALGKMTALVLPYATGSARLMPESLITQQVVQVLKPLFQKSAWCY